MKQKHSGTGSVRVFGDAVASVSAESTAVKRNDHGRFMAGTAQPPRRGRGGQRGNLNACKNPWRAFWQRRALRPEDRWILPLLADYTAGLVSDRGGPEAMTAGEQHMIELAALARGCTMLVLAQAASGNDGKGGLGIAGARITWDGGAHRVADQDLAGALVRFMAVESGALRAIGLERRARPVNPLDAVRQAVRQAARETA